MEEGKFTNYDHPSAFDFSLLCGHLKSPKERRAIQQPIYDYPPCFYKTASRSVAVIIVEGIMLFDEKQLAELMDIKVFIETDIRRLLRDTVERGRTVDQSIQQYLFTARLGYEAFVEPARKNDPISVHNTVGVNMLIDKIRYLISRS